MSPGPGGSAVLAVATVCLVLGLAGGCGEAAPRVEWSEEAVELRGVSAVPSEEARERFPVHTAEGFTAGHPALAGRYEAADGTLRFVPSFPLAPGQSYVARWLGPGGEELLRAEHVFPLPDLAPRARVAAIYPGSEELPANLLRVYLEFSHPMSTGSAARHVRLLRLDDGGESEVVEPFVAPDTELWDPDHRRRTLLFDPGRLKQGVGPNLELGPVLVPGGRYRLEVDAAWRDARGAPLAEDFSHTFQVIAPDRSPPDPARWTLTPPSGPDRKLELAFPEPLDRALLARCLEVETAAGEIVAGRVEIPADERSWHFQPDQLWSAGAYRVVVAPILEDPSGNRPGRPFDAPLGAYGEPTAPPEEVVLDFRVFVD